MKAGLIATAAVVGLLVAMEFLAPGHWGFLTNYLEQTFNAIVRRFS